MRRGFIGGNPVAWTVVSKQDLLFGCQIPCAWNMTKGKCTVDRARDSHLISCFQQRITLSIKSCSQIIWFSWEFVFSLRRNTTLKHHLPSENANVWEKYFVSIFHSMFGISIFQFHWSKTKFISCLRANFHTFKEL